MRNYEIMYIIAPNLEEAATKETVERFNKVLTDNGAEVEKVEEIGKRRLAYEIENYREGYYVVVNLKSGAEAINEFNRLVKINDNVIRSLVVKEDE